METLPEKLSGILVANATHYQNAAKGAFAENTERARKADWKLFHAWCVEKNYISLPKEVRMGF